MEDFNSKYTGEDVEQLLDQVANGEVGGETLTEADIANMGFTKNQGTITEVKMNGVSKGTSGVVELDDVASAGTLNALAEAFGDLDEVLEEEFAKKQDSITDLAAIRDGASKGATAVQPRDISEFITVEDVATVATSGSYNDLQDKPTIPSAVTESTVSGWGFTKNTGTYSKPSGGIPETDLSSDVRSALVAAQSYKGTVTNITINGSTKSPSGGVVDLGSVGTYSKPSTGIPKTDLASDVQSALVNANNAVTREQFGDMEVIQTQGFEGSLSGKLYALPDEATDDEDDILLSRDTVKTINGQSIYGSGNITIEGGGGSSGGSEYAGNYPVVNHGTSDIGTSREHYKLSPNTFHIWGEVTTLYLEKGNAVSGVANEYLFQFTSGMNPTTLTWRGDDRWGNNEAPVIESGYKYQISILEGVMCFTKCVTDISTIDPL